jgi:hypothetical protein
MYLVARGRICSKKLTFATPKELIIKGRPNINLNSC